jgi:hypothetical protein
MLLRGKACDHTWQTPRFPSSNKSTAAAGRLSPVVVVAGHDRKWNNVSKVVYVTGGGSRHPGGVALWRRAMGIDWMTRDELAQAIPPAYTEFLGRQVVTLLETGSPFGRR